MSGACARTIGPRIRINPHDDASARCSASNRPDQPSASCPFTPRSSSHLPSYALRPPSRSVPDVANRDRGLSSNWDFQIARGQIQFSWQRRSPPLRLRHSASPQERSQGEQRGPIQTASRTFVAEHGRVEVSLQQACACAPDIEVPVSTSLEQKEDGDEKPNKYHRQGRGLRIAVGCGQR